ncbi:MAG: hypothetical protein IJZ33_07055 [Clostridia bacterium]|nr:hypothetical protein [Clostridia bacterium]
MKRDDLIEALNGISEENLLEGIALAETAALPAKTSKRRIARISLLAGVAVILALSTIAGSLLLKNDGPAPTLPPVLSPDTPNTESDSSVLSNMNLPVEVQRFTKNGNSYISFTPTDDILTLCQYMDKTQFMMPEHIPAVFKRTDCMPFQNMDNMVNMALTPDSIPLWLASYLLANFEQDENGIALPDPGSLYLPTLPDSFYCGFTYMLTGNYRVQIRSHYFTNGLFDAFVDRSEYEQSINDITSYLKDNPDVLIRDVTTQETDGIPQTITTYSENGIRYTRVESRFTKDEKNFYVIETYPMPHLENSTAPLSPYSDSIIIYVEQDGLYGWFYLTEFGKALTLDDISCFGLTAYQPS